jgi:restriction system protein
MAETMIWGMHAGKKGEADPIFLKKNAVALGWVEIGDLSKITPNKESFKEAVSKAYPNKKSMSIAIDAGQLFRFAYEIKPGDLVIYPSKRDREVHFGRIEGDYFFYPGEEYIHRRPVKWLKSFPRTRFSQAALYEIGSAISLFQVKNNAEEFRAALDSKISEPQEDGTQGPDADDIEQMTRDFVLKTLSRDLKGHPLADFVAHILNIIGYHTRISPEGPDGGIDIIAHKDELGFEPPIVKVQVKSIDGNIGDPMVSSLYGKVGSEEHGLLVALGSYTQQAKNFAKSKTNLRLIDGQELVDLILSHYDDLDSRYKGLLPLKRVYIPESIKDQED